MNWKNVLKPFYHLVNLIILPINWIIPDNDNIWTFSSRYGFSENPKYIFLKLCESHSEIRGIWIGRDSAVISRLRGHGFEAYHSFSVAGLWWQLRAGVVIQSHTFSSYEQFWGCSYPRSVFVNAGHYNYKFLGWSHKSRNLLLRLYRRLRSKRMYSIYSNDPQTFEPKPFVSDVANNSKPLVVGSPKCDVLHRQIRYSKLQSNTKLDTIPERNLFTFFYLPTAISKNWDSPLDSLPNEVNLELIDTVLTDIDAELFIKLHPRDRRYATDHNLDNVTIIEGDFDIYPYLNFADAVISDYSAIIFDLLQTNIPLIRFLFDTSPDQLYARSREVSQSYRGSVLTESEDNPIVPCEIAFDVQELIQIMRLVSRGDYLPDNRIHKRDMFFRYHDAESSERAIKAIQNLVVS